MNNSKPRKGGSRRSSKKAKTQRFRIPKGFEGAGKFVSRDSWEMHWKYELAKVQKEERLRRDREAKAATRARRQPLMAQADGLFVTNAELRERLKGWGSASTGHLKEKTVYDWHGVFCIQGNGAAMQKALNLAGSDARAKNLPSTADRNFTHILTPFFASYTPSQAEIELPEHAAQMTAQLERTGVTVVYLGAFWKKV